MKHLLIATIVVSVFSIVNSVVWIVACFKADKKLAKHGESKFYEVKTKK